MKEMHSTESGGLGSAQGIRWLLAVGGLVLAVSVVRLVESQWAGMSASSQFLTLVTGSLAVFGAGEVLRHRLRLPIAGSALQWLFAVLVPVLSWGAAYLNLLATTLGVAVYGASMMGLMAAFRRCLEESLGYRGALYPVAFGLLTMSLPLLARWQGGELAFIGAPLGLGAVFHWGARHVNRFLFHRDRRDGKERPMHGLPFLALGVLYVASLSVLELPLSHLALPLVVAGAVFVTTGEEYYLALVRALRAQPGRWPSRSVALLSLGFTLVVVAGPFAFLDESGRVPAVVFILATALLLRWSFRYRSLDAHIVALGTSIVGYHFLPALLPAVGRETLTALIHGIGLTDAIAATAFGHLGLALVFVALARIVAPELAGAHARFAALHLVAIVAISVLSGAKIVAPLALLLALTSTAITRRPQWLVPAHAALGASILSYGGIHGMEILAVVLLGVALLVKSARYRAHVLAPAFFWAAVIAIDGLVGMSSGGMLEVFLSGLLVIVLGRRFERPMIALLGLGLSSLGLHGELALTYAVSQSVFVVATLLLFTASFLWWHRAHESWELPAGGAMLGHGALGLAWLFDAVVTGPVTVEPLIIALLGWAVLSTALEDQDRTGASVGFGLLVAYAPFHLWAAGYVTSMPVALVVTLGSLLVARAVVPPFLVLTIERFLRLWRVAAVATALVSVGLDTLAVAAAVVLVGVLEGRVPYRSSLLFVGHALVWLERASAGFFPAALIEAGVSAFPLAAGLALGWILLAERSRATTLRPWTIALESGVTFGFLLSFPPIMELAPWEYVALLLIAGAFAFRQALASYRLESGNHAWTMQAWLGLSAIVIFHAGWLSFGSGRAPYVMLAAALFEYVLATLWSRYRAAEHLWTASLLTGQALAVVGGVLASVRMQPIPLFLASLFFLLVASRETRRIFSSVMSSLCLGMGLLTIAGTRGIGLEFYALAPGFSLVALSLLLSEEMGPRWSRHVFTAGGAFIYMTPILALYDEITWGWQAVLLLLTLGFGSASFWLRSRPLLLVSTAALVIDLACFGIKIRATEPILLWVGGIVLGLTLMSLAAYLEYRREGLAQQVRVFGRELAHWY